MATKRNTSQRQLIKRLDSAHYHLVHARTIAALTDHSSFNDIGVALDAVETALSLIFPDGPRLKLNCNTDTPNDA